MRTVVAGGLPIGDGHPPRVMGVLNLSPESPYEPSVFDDPAAAAAYADGLIDEGADIVDVGLESANKRFEVRSADWELDRLDLALETVARIEGEAVLSIETRYARVAAAALERGFDMVNDIGGFADPEMPAVCAAEDAAVVKMAGAGDLERPGALDDVDAIYDALADGLTDRTIVDPAFGGWTESKTLAADRATLSRLREFRALGQPILVSINRKNFLKDVVDRDTEGALPASLAATSIAVERGAHVVRTHDVAETRDAALIGHAFARERARSEGAEELDVTTVREAERAIERVGGPTDRAVDLVSRAYRVEGLDADAADRLAAAAADLDLVVVTADGSALVGGSASDLAALADRLEGTAVAALASTIRG